MYPPLVGHLLYPLHERLKRKPTFPWLRELERTQWLDLNALREYQFRRLRNHLEWSYTHVPYYRALFDDHGVHPARISSFEDFHRVPFLTRKILRSRFQDLRATVKLPYVKRQSTGGSTGEPVTVEVDPQRMGLSEAARLRAHRWFGLQPGAREIVLWGAPIELGRQDRLRNLRDWVLNSRLLSAFDMSEAALRRYTAVIARYRPQKMYGYASSLFLLARYFERHRIPAPPGLTAVFPTAEPLFDFQRTAIQEALGVRVGVEYGSRDGGVAALECPAGGLHIFAEGMVVEIADPDATGCGEIVVTCLDSLCFPIIRYRTGDIGSFDPTPCPCGRALPKLKAVAGRRTDFLVTPRGRVLHALSAIYILRDHAAVQEFRVVQDAVDHLTVQIVTTRSLTTAEEATIRHQFSTLMGSEVSVDLEDVPSITRTRSGKFRYVESRVADAMLDSMMRETR
jgi:phenylacetate-CoA ligase